MARIGFIGAGKMGSALIRCIQKANIAKAISAYDPNSSNLAQLKGQSKVSIASGNEEVVKKSGIVFLAIKPFLMAQILNEIKPHARKNQLFVSIAAGVKLDAMQKILTSQKVIRVMPNLCCIAGEMAAGYSLGRGVTKADSILIKRILDSAGQSFEVKESQLDAITGLSGSGPAFVAYLIGAFAKAGTQAGIPKDISLQLSRQTFLGTAKLLQDSKISEEELIGMVATKGGTTEAGLKVLGSSEVADALKRTVRQATLRSKELGK